MLQSAKQHILYKGHCACAMINGSILTIRHWSPCVQLEPVVVEVDVGVILVDLQVTAEPARDLSVRDVDLSVHDGAVVAFHGGNVALGVVVRCVAACAHALTYHDVIAALKGTRTIMIVTVSDRNYYLFDKWWEHKE